MGRRLVPLVARIALAAAGLAACTPDLPREVSIDDRFTDAEVAHIEDAIAIANTQLGEALLGHPVIDPQGLFTDEEGFHFTDFQNGWHGIYLVERGTPEDSWIENWSGEDIAGYGTLADVLLVDPDDPAEPESLQCFERIAMHELGHFMGMLHNPDVNAVMYGGPANNCDLDYTASDKQAFCIDYPCVNPPPAN